MNDPLARFRSDFEHCASKALKIRTKAGRIEPFVLNEAQRRRNAKAALDQPLPMDGGVGNRAGRARQSDVSQMSDADFRAIPEAEKKRMRGD